jgi:hypothetical protein
VLLVPDNRLLARVVVVAGGHGLVPLLVDARLVSGPTGVVGGLVLGRALTVVLPRAVLLAVAPRPVHFPTPSHCADGTPLRRAAGVIADDERYHYPRRRRVHIAAPAAWRDYRFGPGRRLPCAAGNSANPATGNDNGARDAGGQRPGPGVPAWWVLPGRRCGG